ncbi:Uncharacterised protein [uncultured archaeon]|nr:Uncharacterised protein [uncultured archaeon]
MELEERLKSPKPIRVELDKSPQPSPEMRREINYIAEHALDRVSNNQACRKYSD